MTASRMTSGVSFLTMVLMAKRFSGAVAITEKDRIPSRLMASVRGIGVAVRVKTSTSARSFLSTSFCLTPKRCSSSMTTNPKRAKFTFSDKSLCVPTTISIVPFSRPSRTCALCLALLKRESSATRTGQAEKRSLKVCACCSANRVVGQRMATCLPPMTAANAALRATSVLPKPTSPHTSRSIGLSAFMSSSTASMAAC